MHETTNGRKKEIHEYSIGVTNHLLAGTSCPLGGALKVQRCILEGALKMQLGSLVNPFNSLHNLKHVTFLNYKNYKKMINNYKIPGPTGSPGRSRPKVQVVQRCATLHLFYVLSYLSKLAIIGCQIETLNLKMIPVAVSGIYFQSKKWCPLQNQWQRNGHSICKNM